MFRLKFTLLLVLVTVISGAAQSTPPGTNAPEATATPGTDAKPFNRVHALLQQGRYDDAISELQQLSAEKLGTAGLPHEFGLAYYKKGEYLKAAEYFHQAISENSADNESVQLLGLSYYLAGRPT